MSCTTSDSYCDRLLTDNKVCKNFGPIVQQISRTRSVSNNFTNSFNWVKYKAWILDMDEVSCRIMSWTTNDSHFDLFLTDNKACQILDQLLNKYLGLDSIA